MRELVSQIVHQLLHCIISRKWHALKREHLVGQSWQFSAYLDCNNTRIVVHPRAEITTDSIHLFYSNKNYTSSVSLIKFAVSLHIVSSSILFLSLFVI